MNLTNVEVKNYRSFLDRHDVDLGDGVNFFVGPNNCGKSNLLRAVALALDPDAPYDPAIDRPMRPGAVGAPLATRITLTFSVGSTGPEQTLLKHAQAYEHAVRQSRGGAITKTTQTFANDGVLKLVTSFAGSGRQVSFQAKAMGGRSISADRPEATKLEEQFRKVVRFAVVRTGEDLESLLAGKFQEILHLVISDHLREQMDKAEKARLEYVQSLQDELLEPLRALVEEITSGMFPEVNVATLIPDVPAVSETISSVDVQLGDAATTTPLSEKGTGLRGAVLTALLQYLADQSARSLVLAVEEPESFLHPAAQEAMGRHLEGMSKPDNVSLLVTTHSPHVMTRDSRSRVSQLSKSAEGWTSIPTTVRGDSDRADVLGSLYSEAGMAKVLERALSVPAGTRAVLVTEGYLDELFLRAACEAAGRSDELYGIHVIHSGGAKKTIVQATLARAATQAPVIVLVDHDQAGRSAGSDLSDLGWKRDRDLLSLDKWPDRCKHSEHDVEIEDLLPMAARDAIVDELGESVAVDGKQRCGSGWQTSYSTAWKDVAKVKMPELLRTHPAPALIWLAEETNRRITKVLDAEARRRAHIESGR